MAITPKYTLAGTQALAGLAALILVMGAGVSQAAHHEIADSSTIHVAPGPNVQEELQEALIEVKKGGTVILAPGVYDMTDGLSLDVKNVTVKGAGKYRTVLSFKNQAAGGEGLLVTSDGVTLKDFAVEDTKGDGIKVKGVNGIKMINLRAEWTNGPDPRNGAYGLYPVESKNVLMDGCVAIGASDAGIYSGQNQHVIIRNSRAEHNVAGIEVENSFYSDVYDNVSVNNTGGILVFDLPDLPQQGGRHTRVFNNVVIANNTPNFAPEGNIVGTVPRGMGIMVMASRQVEVVGNYVDGNQSAGMLVLSYPFESRDRKYDPHSRAVVVRGNFFGNNGYDPKDEIGAQAGAIAGVPVPDIVWDGVLPTAYKDGNVPAEDWIYIEDNGDADFINMDLATIKNDPNNATPTRDLAPHKGTLPALPPVELTFK